MTKAPDRSSISTQKVRNIDYSRKIDDIPGIPECIFAVEIYMFPGDWTDELDSVDPFSILFVFRTFQAFGQGDGIVVDGTVGIKPRRV